MVMNPRGNAKARAGLCRVIERRDWHLLGVTVNVERFASIETRLAWFGGRDSERADRQRAVAWRKDGGQRR